jgi:hypothetical protein
MHDRQFGSDLLAHIKAAGPREGLGDEEAAMETAASVIPSVAPPPTQGLMPMPAGEPLFAAAAGPNDIKVMLDGAHLRVAAYVDLKGAKRLMKALRANIALLALADLEL